MTESRSLNTQTRLSSVFLEHSQPVSTTYGPWIDPGGFGFVNPLLWACSGALLLAVGITVVTLPAGRHIQTRCMGRKSACPASWKGSWGNYLLFPGEEKAGVWSPFKGSFLIQASGSKWVDTNSAALLGVEGPSQCPPIRGSKGKNLGKVGRLVFRLYLWPWWGRPGEDRQP